MEHDSSKRVVARPHMPMSERAKIFIPFDPLKGFREALAERERRATAVHMSDLSDEVRGEMSRVVATLEPGDTVCVSHYVDGHYETVVGPLTKVDVTAGVMYVAGLPLELSAVRSVERVEEQGGAVS
ncbi:MAG: hypothetical protein J6D54_12570 [Olsenella sp.]|nr:hypothetical protein [Olsenella sp.]